MLGAAGAIDVFSPEEVHGRHGAHERLDAARPRPRDHAGHQRVTEVVKAAAAGGRLRAAQRGAVPT
jgi:hypothetical protein